MSEDRAINQQPLPEFGSYQELGEFWDTHSLSDYWEETEPAELDFDAAIPSYLIAVDPDLLKRVQRLAYARGLSTQSLVNLMLEQRFQEMAVGTSRLAPA